ncbi:MAG: biliverdin-producing heme oxygenase [Burkholderiales bacterium]
MSAVLQSIQTSATALAVLRESTADMYRTLDQNSCMTALMLPDLQLERYAQVLMRLYAIYRPLESALFDAEQVHGRVGSWYPKYHWLEDDLLMLSQQGMVSLCDLETVRPCGLTIGSRAELAGCHYVLESATLGGQMIAACVRASLGQRAQLAMQFLSGYGSDTHPRWGKTCQQIETALDTPKALFDACAKARAVFALFIAGLAQRKLQSV